MNKFDLLLNQHNNLRNEIPSNVESIIGEVYNNYTVISFSKTKLNRSWWLCRCNVEKLKYYQNHILLIF